MANTILKSLSAENFASFAEQVVFTTEIDPSKKEHLDNTFEVEDTRFNKVSFLYGANGSGKSTIKNAWEWVLCQNVKDYLPTLNGDEIPDLQLRVIPIFFPFRNLRD